MIKFTLPRGQIRDLDSLPLLDRGLIDYEKYHQFIAQSGARYCMSIYGSRGCPFRCFYCDSQHIFPMHRRKSVYRIKEEIDALYEAGVRDIEFIDDAFNIRMDEFMAFFDLMTQGGYEGLNFHFINGLRGDLLTHEAIDKMVLGGTSSINLSLESASPRLQKLMKKNLKLDILRDNLEYIAAYHPSLMIGLNAMHGFPTETEEEAIQTVEFIESIKWLHFVQLFNVRIFPNSAIERIALENGVTQKQIDESLTMPFHQIPTTIPFSREFSQKLRLRFTKDYLFNRERLRHVIKNQWKVCSEDQLLFKYQTMMPGKFKNFDDVLKIAKIKREELGKGVPPKDIQIHYRRTLHEHEEGALRFLFVDASEYFSTYDDAENKISDPPTGHMALLSYLHDRMGGVLCGRIVKSYVDYDSFDELGKIVDQFKPDVIGIRTLSFYKDFFEETVGYLKASYPGIPIIAGGPHPTIDARRVLEETEVDIVVIGEGELTLHEICEMMYKNKKEGKRFIDFKRLSQIKGIAYRAE